MISYLMLSLLRLAVNCVCKNKNIFNIFGSILLDVCLVFSKMSDLDISTNVI